MPSDKNKKEKTSAARTLPGKLVLASKSPRRSELLTQAGIPFEIKTVPVEEETFSGDAERTVCTNAAKKAEAVFAVLKQENGGKETKTTIVLGADTVVVLRGKILGKPEDKEDAALMLGKLSGKTHLVLTGISLLSENRQVTFAVASRVKFRKITEAEIRKYMKLVNVLDKAGAYAIQEHGEMIIEKFEGALDNIIGLPVAQVLEELYLWPER